MDASLSTTTFKSRIMGTSVNVSLTIRNTYEATMEFTLFGAAYTFTVTRWSRKGLSSFLLLFFAYKCREAADFGSLTVDDNGVPTFNMTTAQKVNAVIQGSKDVMACVDEIGTRHQRSVLDYAVWYREKHTCWDTYENYITMLACNCIVHTDFLAPGVTWELVTFGMA
eukprot:gene27517-biopygen12961